MTLGQINFSPNVSALQTLLDVTEKKLAEAQADLEASLKREAALREEIQNLKQQQ